MRGYNVAVAGATGVVGRKMLEVLEERGVPVENLYPLASARSAGKTISFAGKEWTVEELTESSFDRPIDFALFSAGGGTSLQFAPIAASKGVTVIDNSSAWRMDPQVPLVVPEVNPQAAADRPKNIIANPNCSTIQAMIALKPILDAYGIRRVVYSTYQSVSGAGLGGITDLEAGVAGIEPKNFARPIAFNLIPQIDSFGPDGYTKEELKMVNETRKILASPHLAVTATCVRVPVYYAHSESVNVQTERPFDIADVKRLLAAAPGAVLMDDPENGVFPTPLDAQDRDEVFIGRVRRDISAENGINMWVVADNVRKGAATNAVQIAQLLIAGGAFGR